MTLPALALPTTAVSVATVAVTFVLATLGSPLAAARASLIRDTDHVVYVLREGETVTADLVDLLSRLASV